MRCSQLSKKLFIGSVRTSFVSECDVDWVFCRYQATTQVHSYHPCGLAARLPVAAGHEAACGCGQIAILCTRKAKPNTLHMATHVRDRFDLNPVSAGDVQILVKVHTDTVSLLHSARDNIVFLAKKRVSARFVSIFTPGQCVSVI